MLIESRTIVGASAALAIVGAALWGSALMMEPPSQSGRVEIRQVEDKSWSVEVKDMGGLQASPSEAQKTAAVTR
ncbi:hypothetical protein HNQ60_000231 [Povalibacter uvarum]|uniref:Uncharacterized protein n=1 Tax=Povalibacter uvarum TaxID=732238 RepID=A0A841HH19_9GAMM|nr:hypothetical protein [Povalibacter uvarum]MBB6091385.1 hypothetical protein [Povalibacter uvarum]